MQFVQKYVENNRNLGQYKYGNIFYFGVKNRYRKRLFAQIFLVFLIKCELSKIDVSDFIHIVSIIKTYVKTFFLFFVLLGIFFGSNNPPPPPLPGNDSNKI